MVTSPVLPYRPIARDRVEQYVEVPAITAELALLLAQGYRGA
jgi:hypothetical protein